MFVDYKMCPLKKRPIVYEDEQEEDDQQPQDLSLKREASGDDYSDEVPPAKRNFVLNLSKNSFYDRAIKSEFSSSSSIRPETPVSVKSESSSSSASSISIGFQHDHCSDHNIHLRGMEQTSNSFRSAFVNAAIGCSPMTALWAANQHLYIPSEIYPSPSSSASPVASPVRSLYNYQPATPPSSPPSSAAAEGPEDLTVTCDIPLPALYHNFDEASLSSSSSSSSSSKTTIRYKCDKCDKMYSTTMGLSKHQQFHCPAADCNRGKKIHSCQECGKLYTTIGALKMHVRTHTLPCKCPICGKAFSRPWLLQGHIRTHTGEKPFKCSECNRSFADRSNLRAHEQTHVVVKKYGCQTCGKSFSRMSLLSKHSNSSCVITVV